MNHVSPAYSDRIGIAVTTRPRAWPSTHVLLHSEASAATGSQDSLQGSLFSGTYWQQHGQVCGRVHTSCCTARQALQLEAKLRCKGPCSQGHTGSTDGAMLQLPMCMVGTCIRTCFAHASSRVVQLHSLRRTFLVVMQPVESFSCVAWSHSPPLLLASIMVPGLVLDLSWSASMMLPCVLLYHSWSAVVSHSAS